MTELHTLSQAPIGIAAEADKLYHHCQQDCWPIRRYKQGLWSHGQLKLYAHWVAGLLLIKLLPPVMTEPAAENEAPLLTGYQGDSPIASDSLLAYDSPLASNSPLASGSPLAPGLLLHTDEEPLVGHLILDSVSVYSSSASCQQLHANDCCSIGPAIHTFFYGYNGKELYSLQS